MSALRSAVSGARSDLPGTVGTGIVIVIASALLTVTGALVESGIRQPADQAGLTLIALGSSFAGIAVILVVIVVAATATLALRRRRLEFALLRAIGATRDQVRRRVSTELLMLSTVAAPLGASLGLALVRHLDPALRSAGLVEPGFDATLSPIPVLSAVLVVVPTALVAGRFAVRETVRAAPTAAIRESAVEHRRVGPARRVASMVCAVAGISAAFAPAVLPGTIGAATAAISAFLLIGAAALAGPLVVEWAFGHTAVLSGGRGGAATRLAVGNLRGFSRRLTAVVVPLALLLAVGTVQTTVGRALQEAATHQLSDALGTGQVAVSDEGLTPDQLASVASTPGVAEVLPIADAPAQVRTDDEGGLPDVLAWEAARLLVVPPEVDESALDPGVTRGDLTRLAEGGAVAISSDIAFESGKGLDDTLGVRIDGHQTDLRVVAVFDHGLGLGDLLVGPATPTELGVRPMTHLALVVTNDPLRVEGVETMGTPAYVAWATSPDAAAQHLSSLLTLLLLVFVGLGSLNALVLLTAGRGTELRLLHRTGATSRQLVAMMGVESVVTGLAAWAIGTAAVVPAVLGVSIGLLGAGVPVLDLTAYLALSSGVVALTIVATLSTATFAVRGATRMRH